MELRELAQPEQKYTYRQSHQLDAQTGCIGYLRGDFGTTGKEFYSSWFDSMAYLKTPEFQAELDRVINALREDSQYSGILADCPTPAASPPRRSLGGMNLGSD